MVYTYTENEIIRIRERIKNGISVDEDGCEIWSKSFSRAGTPVLRFTCEDRVKRDVSISKFIWTEINGLYDSRKQRLTKTCHKGGCLSLAHFSLKRLDVSFDHKHVYDKILSNAILKDNGCMIIANGGISSYTTSKLDGVNMVNHRIVFIVKNNNGNHIPSHDKDGEPLVIRHICNEPSCVNPLHLKIGTQSENCYEDKISAGTLLQGEKNPNATITEQLAKKIKLSKKDKGDPEYLTGRERAKLFGVSVDIVSRIDTKKSWSHIPDRNGVTNPNNENHRRKVRYRTRAARAKVWNERDFIDASEKIKNNIMESDIGKSGRMPPGKCWIWQKSTDKFGYGVVGFKHICTRAHVLSCEAKNMRRTKNGEIVRHLCDNPPCCNPDHIEFGSNKENSNDIVLSGSSKSFKLGPASVRHIRSSKKTNEELAKEYKVRRGTIYNVRTGRTWSSVV